MAFLGRAVAEPETKTKRRPKRRRRKPSIGARERKEKRRDDSGETHEKSIKNVSNIKNQHETTAGSVLLQRERTHKQKTAPFDGFSTNERK